MLPILDKIINKNKEVSEYFLTLEIKETTVKAAVWKTVNAKTVIIGTDVQEISFDWNQIIEATDKVITKSSINLPPESVKKTIFGLPSFWAIEGKIKSEYLENLKKLCKKLDLTPLGFVEIHEAIIAQIQANEQAPLTAILVEVGKDKNYIVISKVGKIKTAKEIGSGTQDLCEQLIEILKTLPEKEILPSRIILYDENNNLDQVKQEIISYPWTQKASFLHFPKVEILPADFELDGLILVGTKEIKNRLFPGEVVAEESSSVMSAVISPNTPITNDLGFIEEKDILETDFKPSITQEPAFEKEPRIEVDISLKEEPISAVQEEEEKIRAPSSPPQPRSSPPEHKNFIPTKYLSENKFNLNKLFFNFKNISSLLPSFLAQSRGLLIIILTVLFMILGFSIFAYINFSTATLKIYVEPQVLEKTLDIKALPETEKADVGKKEINTQSIKIEESDTQKITTTGEKTIGEKAKGEVTLYNKTTTGSKTFKSGTILIGPDEKEFTLDSDITIPAATSQTEGITFGKIKASVTAFEIGPEYNLTAGKKEFTVKEYPATSYSALSETAFSGGTSKKVKIVSKTDQSVLLDQITKKLQEKAKTEFKNKIDKEQKIISETLKILSHDNKYSAKIDEEADELSLTSKIKFQVLAYKETDLQKILEANIKNFIPDQYEYQKSATNIAVKDISQPEEEEGNLTLKIAFKTKLIPKINKEKLVSDLTGKNLSFVNKYLNSIPEIAGFEISKITPRLPNQLLFFPRKSKNITIIITPKE